MWTSTEEDGSKKITSGEESQNRNSDSYNILLRIKHGVVEKCLGTSLHPFLRCLDEQEAHYKPFSHCQYHAGGSFEDGNTYH